MLKISQAGKADYCVTLKLEGRVVGPWVSELRQVCETHLSEGRSLKLDLTDVTFADADGVASGTPAQNRRADALPAIVARAAAERAAIEPAEMLQRTEPRADRDLGHR